MHKKLAADLTSIAHSILKMKNKEDVLALKVKAHEVYEKLALLAYVEEYMLTTPNANTTKEALLLEVEQAVERQESLKTNSVIVDKETKFVEEVTTITAVAEEVVVHTLEDVEEETIQVTEIEQPFEELENLIFGDEDVKDDVKDVAAIKTEKLEVVEREEEIEDVEEDISEVNTVVTTLEEELEGTIPVDVMANLFEKAPVQKTLNSFLQNTIQIGLNDRIAFVSNLFNGSQVDFNRVVSQLNTMKTEKEAKNFISRMVKPDYDWTDKEAYELRFLEIIERKFA